MKKYAFALVSLFLLNSMAFGQNKKFTVEESVLLGGRLRPARVRQLNWIPETSQFAYVKQVDDKWKMMTGNASSEKREVLTSLDDFNKALSSAKLDEMKAFPGFRMLSDHHFRFFSGNQLCTFDWTRNKVELVSKFDKNGANRDLSMANGIAYTIDQNLFVSVPGKPDVAVTKESNKGIRTGEAAHRNEFGIVKGTFFSDQGDQLAYYRVDETMVTDYSIYDLSTQPATMDVIKYPMAGAKSHHATVGVFNTKTGKTTFLKTTGDPEHYLTNITWSPDGKSIYVAELNRDQNHLKMNRYNAASGEFEKTLFEEKEEKYVEPKHGPKFIPGNSELFIWQSQRDGNNHLYLYNTDGELQGQLTKGDDWLVTSILGFDAKSKNVFIQTTGNYGQDRLIKAVDLKKMTTRTLAGESGVHQAVLSPKGDYFIDIFSNTTTPNQTTIRSTKNGKVAQVLLDAPNPLAKYAISVPELGTIKAADGKTDLSYRLFKPVGMEKGKKYPVIIYVYNGPGVQLVRNSFQAASPLWMEYAAQQGYVVFTVDGRGSANRGKAFEQAIFRDLGTVETADQLKGVEFLKSLPYVDGDRMAIHGWSYGGFMTCNLMLRAPGTFKVGVGGGPVIDWNLYEIMYTERYMDTPQTNKEGYDKALTTNYIKDLEGKLLLIHGTSDPVVVWQHSLNMVEAAVSEGVQLDYFVYPGHPHNVRGKDRAHLMRKVLDYIMDEL